MFDVPSAVEYADNINAVGAGHIEEEVCREARHRNAAHTFETRYAGIVRSSGARLFGQPGTRLIHGREVTFGHFHSGMVCQV